MKKEKRIDRKTVLLLRSGRGRYAIRKRSGEGLLADMWELVNFDGHGAEGDVESYLAEKGIRAEEIFPLADSCHIFTHVIWEMKGFAVSVSEESDAFIWKTKEEIASSFAIPTAFRAYLKLMKE